MKKFWETVKQIKALIFLFLGCILSSLVAIELLPLRFCIILLYISLPVLLFMLFLAGETLWSEVRSLFSTIKKREWRQGHGKVF